MKKTRLRLPRLFYGSKLVRTQKGAHGGQPVIHIIRAEDL